VPSPVATSPDYSDLTVDPTSVAIPSWETWPLDDLGTGTDPGTNADAPRVLDPVGEDLVPAVRSGVQAINAYRAAGWLESCDIVLVRSGLVERLQEAEARLPVGFGLAIFDAWRPQALQRALYEAARTVPGAIEAGLVAEPSCDGQLPSPHQTGGAVDVTLRYAGRALALGTDFDAFNDRTATRAFEQTPGLVRDLRRTLYWAMADAGFVNFAGEWWHYEYGTSRWAAQTGLRPVYGFAHP